MADFPCASTKRTSQWPAPMSWEKTVRFCVSVVVATLLLTGCNANQAINPSGQSGRCANDPALRSLQSHQLRTEQHRECGRWRHLIKSDGSRYAEETIPYSRLGLREWLILQENLPGVRPTIGPGGPWEGVTARTPL